MTEQNKKMTSVAAVKKFMEDPRAPSFTTSDFMLFWKACDREERESFAATAAKELGVELANS